MPTLNVDDLGSRHLVPCAAGTSVRDALLSSGQVLLRADCNGMGSCGQCIVRIDRAAEYAPTPVECARLSPGQLDAGLRLACQVKPRTDLCVETLRSFSDASGRRLEAGEYSVCSPAESCSSTPREGNGRALGIAVDLGSTQIKLSLWNRESSLRLSGRSMRNPQGVQGADVLSRIAAASASQAAADRISALARTAIAGAVQAMTAEAGYRPADVGEIVVVGNTAMLALLAKKNQRLLLQPEYWSRPIDCIPEAPEALLACWGVAPDARLRVVPPLAGFVGSDLLAGVLALDLAKRPAGTFLIDFGTNSEIAFWDGTTLWVTSAAGGPAFEGGGIGCGMSAEPGAIYRAVPAGNGLGFSCAVIRGSSPLGICGSGLIDIIAFLRNDGILNRLGKFEGSHDNMFVVSRDTAELTVTERDLDQFMRAKAAIGAGISCLMQRCDGRGASLGEVCISGAFGRWLDVQNAQALGVLPALARERVALCGNTALAGCERILLSPDADAVLEPLRRVCRVLNLAEDPDFERFYVENLYLQPMRLH